MGPHTRRTGALLGLFLLGSGLLAAATTEWLMPEGVWSQPEAWSRGIPDASIQAGIHGKADVTISRGEAFAGRLDVGTQPGDRVHLLVDGGHLVIRQDSLIVGEATGSDGYVELNDGAIYSMMDLFLGGATASGGRMAHALLQVRGGTLEGLSFVIGNGWGGDAGLEIEGSRAIAVHALESVHLNARADPGGQAGRATLGFTLDRRGVTPIVIQSRWDGLRIDHDARSRCELAVRLAEAPPEGNILLVRSHVPVEGTFSDLPEGARIQADFLGRTYAWTLTYRGGAEGHDVVLQAPGRSVQAEPPATIVLPWEGRPMAPLSLPLGTPAFAGAEGYGAYTPGGRGGRRIEVTTLADHGPGSLRAAIEATGPRTIAFAVGGVIDLQTPLTLTEPFLTVDGSEAPSPGITLRRHGITVKTHDVVLRQFRIRIGDDAVAGSGVDYGAGEGEVGLQFVDGSRDCIADHLSVSWATSKLLSTTKGADLITVQWCLLAESLNLAQHGYASIAGGSRVSWHHNLFAHNWSRNPRFQGAVDADFRNNVIYDWGDQATYGEFERLNFVGNYLKPGPSRPSGRLLFHSGKEVVPARSLYLHGNVLEGEDQATQDNWKGTRFYYDRARIEAAEPFNAPAISETSAAQALAQVLAQAGATRPARDAVDARVTRDVSTGTGTLVTSVAQAGGWPTGRASPPSAP